MEPYRDVWEEGTMRRAGAVGALDKLLVVMDQLFRVIGDGRSVQGESEAMDADLQERRGLLEDMWKEIDFDGNGYLSETEAFELIRLSLAQKALSSILPSAMLEDLSPLDQLASAISEVRHVVLPDSSRVEVQTLMRQESVNSVRDKALALKPKVLVDRVRNVLVMAVSNASLEIAASLHHRARAFWLMMDADHNGKITKDEFIITFPAAVMKSVHGPVRMRAEQIAWEAMLAGCLQDRVSLTNPSHAATLYMTAVKSCNEKRALGEADPGLHCRGAAATSPGISETSHVATVGEGRTPRLLLGPGRLAVHVRVL